MLYSALDLLCYRCTNAAFDVTFHLAHRAVVSQTGALPRRHGVADQPTRLPHVLDRLSSPGHRHHRHGLQPHDLQRPSVLQLVVASQHRPFADRYLLRPQLLKLLVIFKCECVVVPFLVAHAHWYKGPVIMREQGTGYNVL